MNGLVVGLLLVGGLALCLYLYGFINQSINLLKQNDKSAMHLHRSKWHKIHKHTQTHIIRSNVKNAENISFR